MRFVIICRCGGSFQVGDINFKTFRGDNKLVGILIRSQAKYRAHHTVRVMFSGNNNYWGLAWVLFTVGLFNLRINNVWGFKIQQLLTSGASSGDRTRVVRVTR